MNKLWMLFGLVFALGMTGAAAPIGSGSSGTGISNVVIAVNNFCYDLRALMPVAAMLMVVVAGVIYAAGQMMGAETRARANVWATACLTGALVGLLIYAIAPSVLQTIYGGNGNTIQCDTRM
ncbi:Uncharacterised protein [uncultured archaeon]|nr:Uncharacterised protein [uncultured archaeon]